MFRANKPHAYELYYFMMTEHNLLSDHHCVWLKYLYVMYIIWNKWYYVMRRIVLLFVWVLMKSKVNSLLPSDAIWWHIWGSILASGNGLSPGGTNTFITWTNIEFSSVRSSDIHLRAISQEIPVINHWNKLENDFPSNFPGANEFICAVNSVHIHGWYMTHCVWDDIGPLCHIYQDKLWLRIWRNMTQDGRELCEVRNILDTLNKCHTYVLPFYTA